MSKKKKEDLWYYFNKENHEVYETKPDTYTWYSCESFIPSMPWKSGWVLYWTYTTYDSFGSDSEVHYGVWDVYDDYYKAAEVARNMRVLCGYDNEKKELARPNIVDGLGNKRNFYHDGWGYDVQSIFVKEFSLTTPRRQERF